MQERHLDRQRYFQEQSYTTKKYVIPFINKVKTVDSSCRILEIGCGEGGNLVPFHELGCKIVGIDFCQEKIANATKFFAEIQGDNPLTFIHEDFYNVTVEEIGKFDIVYTRDVLEHIHGQEKFLQYVQKFLKPDGKFFLGFPPWHNPFGGHQQICKSKFLSRVPYFHILPNFLYKGILKLFGESSNTIDWLLETKETQITIGRFEKIAKRNNYKIDRRTLYLINPNYEIKFGLKPRISKIIANIPVLRSFIITTNYYVISKND